MFNQQKLLLLNQAYSSELTLPLFLFNYGLPNATNLFRVTPLGAIRS